MSFNAESLPIELNGVSYLVDTAEYRRTTVPVSRQQRDNSREPGENTLDTTGAWVRSQTDWSYGAGQLYLDNEDSDRRRFYESVGVDIWTRGQITLLPIAETPGALPATSFIAGEILVHRVVQDSTGTEYLYVANGTTLSHTSDPLAGSPTWTSITVGGTTTSITSDGTNIYLGFDGVIVAEKSVIGSSSTATFGSLDPNIIKVAAGRLIAAEGNTIYELDAAGAKAASSLDYSLPLASSVWVDVDACPNGIYAAANTDNTGTVYFISVNSTDGTLVTPIVAGSLPRNESINAILSYGPVLCLATSQGFRTALIDVESGGVTIGSVIDTGGEAYSLEADGRFVWWGGAYGNLFRADLTRFTDTLVPAYASDLVSSVSATATDLVGSMTRVNNAGNPKMFFGVKKASAAAILQNESKDNTRVASGTMNAGEITWSTVAPKLLRSGVIDLDRSQFERSSIDYRQTGIAYDQTGYEYRFGVPTSEAAGEIRLTATNNADVSATLLDMATQVPQTFDFGTSTDTAISFDLTVTLVRGTSDATIAPILHDWQLTAVAVPRRIDEIIIPIVLRRDLLTSRNSGAPISLVAGNTFSNLRTLMENGTAVSYKEGTRTDTVTIERLEMQPERLSDDGSWWEGTLLARLLTVPV
mgnify:CR=1 FL=1|tara:strand:+ start:4261 stop:6192 length:1932 start_codon:yes stop_codon:yes gene_type:complete